MKRKFTLLIAALALLTMIVQPRRAWGQVVSGTTYNTTSSTNFPTGWTYDGEFATGNNPYLKLVASTNYIQTSNFAQNGFTSIKLKARKFGGPSAAEALITVSWYNNNTETVLGTIAPTSTTLTDYTISSPTNPTGNTTGYIKIQCKGASGSKGSGVSAVTITYTAGGDPTETHILTFVAAPAAGGTVSVNNNTTGTITLEEGENYNIIATPSEVGYAFNNWTVSGTGSSVGNASNASTTFTMGTEDATLTANFSTVTTYTVTYLANVTGIDNIETEYNAGSNVIVAENTFSNPGHAFTKWHTNAGGTGGTDYNPGDEIENISANINLYAQWEESSEATATLNIQSYGTAQGWDNGTQHTSITIDQVSFTASNGNNTGKYYNNVTPHEWRFYQSESATITISVPDGYHLVSITPTFSTNNGGVLLNGSTSVASGSTVSVSSTSVTFSVGNSGTATNGQVKFTNIIVNYEYEGGTTTPSYTITDNNELAYNATSGSFDFTVNNPVADGVTTVSEDVDWISNVAISDNSVTFNTTANEGAQREGVITLTYTYNTTETVTKEVTITQAAAPVVYSTIPALFAAATTTETNVLVTFNNWVVSGVSTNGKNIFVTDNNGKGFVIYYTSDMSNTFAAGDVLSGTAVSCTLKLYNGFAELLNVNATDLTITAGGSVTTADIAMAELTGVNTGALVHYENLTCSVDNNKYYLSDGTTTLQVFNSLYAFEALENGKTYNITGIYQQYNTTKEILPRSADDIEEVVPTEPTITVQPATVNSPFTGAEGTLTVTYENITTIVAEVKFYEADGVTEATYDWIDAEINSSNNVDYIIDANTGEARSAYLKVYALGNDSQDVYSNLVTINQAEYVAPSYAELPFEFNGGRADIENTDGLTQEGLGTDYNASTNPNTQLKFDGTGDWLLLQFNERPGTLTFDIKGNSFSEGTFKVQTSTDGTTYTDLGTYNALGDTQSEEFNLADDVRYIKWVYTEKSNGNVGLGNIGLTEYVEPTASITVTPNLVEATIAETDDYLGIAYVALDITQADDFGIQFYDNNSQELNGDDEPDWIQAEAATQIGQEGYFVYYVISANTGAARSAYFKVYAFDNNAELVYSNLVTVNQAAVPSPVINAEDIEIEYDATSGEIAYTINNPTTATLTATTTAEWISNITVEAAKVTFTTTVNEGDADRIGTITLSYTGAEDKSVTVKQGHHVVDYAILPFEWEGGSSADFAALNGVTLSGNGSDYGSTHAPYLIKLDSDNDYIMVKTDSQPGNVTIGVKMIGGGNTSTITVKASADGETFDDGETLTISGAQNAIVNLETTRSFGAEIRYIKMVFTKGSNVGVGPIAITKYTTDPIINAEDVNITCDATNGSIAYTISNPVVGGVLTASTTSEWLVLGSVTTSVPFTCTANTTEENRSATVTLTYTYNTSETVTKDVTVTQSKRDYATMPFAFDGGRNDIENTAGLTQDGLDSDYGSSPKLKFNTAGDWMILKLNAAPVSLSYDIKGNGFSGGTFTVQTSANGTDYYDLATYTELGDVQSITHVDLDASVRYIKWTYTSKSNGNVALGNIHATDHYDTYGDVTFNDLDLTAASESLIIHSGSVVTVNGELTNNSPDNLVIEDGGQLIHNVPVSATIQRNVKGYNANRDANNSGYMLIASPVSAPINVTSTNLINGNYDLYIFDEGQQDNEKEWRNYKANEFTTIANTKGYLYANESNGTISFAGELKPSINPVTINLDYTDGNRFAGWNLVGNPFACNAYAYDTIGKSLAFFKMNTTGDGFVAVTTGAIAPMEGIFVKASEAGQNFAFTKEAPVSNPGKGNLNIQVAQANTGRDAQHISDNAIIRFDGGNNLEKFSFNDNGDKLYFTLGNKDYSVFNAEARGEMPVNFKAAENGTYTIDFSMDNVEFSYLHLIDNKTGMDIDLLQTSSYTFEASKIDYASRFKLVFSTNSNSYSNDDNDFAFFDANGNLLILGNEGSATLQVIDITGRTVSNETFSGNYSKAINAKAGVYMLRLIQGNDVRTQKIVVR